MRVHSSGYGNSVFDVRREYRSGQKKIIKLSVYFALFSFGFYVLRFVFEINMAVIKDMAMKAISGDIESINLDVYADRFKSNQVVAFIISSYYVVEKFAGNVKTFIINIIDKSLLFFKEKVN